MKISVVIPCYNEEKYLKNCLLSIINQTKKPNEIIIVDNNSTDNSIKIAKKYQKKYSSIKIVKEKNQGISYSRNKGFNTAKGDILVKCDADTILSKQWLAKVNLAFKKNKNIIAYTNHFLIYDVFLIKNWKIFSFVYQWLFKLLSGYHVLLGPALAIRKTSWLKIKNQVCLDDNQVHEDIDLTIHISTYGKIYLDKSIDIRMSGRRIKYNPFSFFVGYPLLFLKMLKTHRKII